MTNPTLVTTPFAENGDKNTIPQSVGAEPQNATMLDGFPEITQTKISEGGIPPDRADFNGILNLYGQHIVHLNKGLLYEFDAAFATAIGGYPLHARIMLNNGDIVRNAVANNTNDPNSDMSGWENNNVITVESVADLADLSVWGGRTVDARAYYENGDVRGGGYFYYDELDTTSTVDNIFIFASSSTGRWKRKLNGTVINTAQAGVLNDGSDQGEKLQALFDAAANASMLYGYTWRITISGLEQRVWSSIPLKCNLTLLELKDIWIISTLAAQSTISESSVAIKFFGSDSWINNKPDTWRRRKSGKLIENVKIEGSAKSNTVGVWFVPNIEGQFANSTFSLLDVTGFDYDVVLSSNCYLMTFESGNFTSAAKYILTYASNIGLETTMSNMGENIRFNDCTFANSSAICELNYQSWITFTTCSFDYNGLSTDVNGWFRMLGEVAMTFISCHFEAGNGNAQLGKYMFYTTHINSSAKLIGGTFMFGTSSNNDYVFYSTQPLNGNFEVSNLWCWSSNVAKKGWSNTSMGRFRLITNTGVSLGNVRASGLQAPNKSVSKDYNFAKSVLMQKPYDFWYVNGLDSTSTSQLVSTSNSAKFAKSTASATGVTYDALVCSPTASDQTLYLLVKRPEKRSNFNPVVRLKHLGNRAFSVYAKYTLADVTFTENAQGVLVPTVDTSRFTNTSLGSFVSVSVDTTPTETTIYTPSMRTFEDVSTFDYVFVQINFAANYNLEYSVTNIEVYEMDN